MTVLAPPAPPADIPVRRSPLRTVLVGIAIAVVFVLVVVVVFAITRAPQREVDYLSPESGSPSGSRALVRVLGDQGVTVESVTRLSEARAVGSDPAETTLAVWDYYLVLGSEQRRELLTLADRVVVFEPWDTELADLAPGVELVAGGFGTSDLLADCTLPAVVQAERVAARASFYDVSEADNPVTTCFGDDEDGETYAVVQTETRGTEVVLVGIPGAFTNGEILEAGNAALALNLLGEDETLIWYIPSLAELDEGDIPSAANLTPPWVTPVVILLLALLVALGVWQGRRVGALVTERLPVVVRANETMEGRARLYERAGARAHALDALRIGTISRLARSCGLPKRSSVDEVVDAVTALTARKRAEVAALLLDEPPRTDADLMRLSDELLILETEVTDITLGR